MKTTPHFNHEKEHWDNNIKVVVGVDEVGRGAFAGPVVVGAVTFDPYFSHTDEYNKLREVNDSKKISRYKRQVLFELIKKHCRFWSIGTVSADTIDKIGITEALKLAAEEALLRLPQKSYQILTDQRLFPKNQMPTNVMEIKKGDESCFSIAAASILAKVWRDQYMQKLSRHPRLKIFKWDQNAGYGTLQHRHAIRLYAPTFFHRYTYLSNTVTLTQQSI